MSHDIYNNVYILRRKLNMHEQIEIYARASEQGVGVSIEGCKVIFPRGYRNKGMMIKIVENTSDSCERT